MNITIHHPEIESGGRGSPPLQRALRYVVGGGFHAALALKNYIDDKQGDHIKVRLKKDEIRAVAEQIAEDTYA